MPEASCKVPMQSERSHPALQPQRRSRGEPTRQRILKAAFAMVARDGLPSLTMQSVALAANVTEMTVYNLFGSKTGLIDKLVETYQSDLVDHSGSEDTGTMPGILAAVRAIALELGREPRWAGAIAHLYFSEKTAPATYQRLRTIGLRHLMLAIELALPGLEHRLQAEVEIAAHLFANTGYALVHDLALGRIDGPVLADHLEFALQSLVARIVAVHGRGG